LLYTAKVVRGRGRHSEIYLRMCISSKANDVLLANNEKPISIIIVQECRYMLGEEAVAEIFVMMRIRCAYPKKKKIGWRMETRD
jgi:hypothetical protein